MKSIPVTLKRPPAILYYALERLKDFVNQPHKFGFIPYNRPGLPRLMRSERRENVQKALLVLIKHIDLILASSARGPYAACCNKEGHADGLAKFFGHDGKPRQEMRPSGGFVCPECGGY